MSTGRATSLVLISGALLGGCGASGGDPSAAGTRAIGCGATSAAAMGEVVGRIYQASAGGSNVGEARKRVERSTALADAVARGSRAAASHILRSLLKGQITRIRVSRGAQVVAEVGSGGALGPSSGVLRDRRGRPEGNYTLAVQGTHSFLSLVRALTGLPVALYSHRRLLPDPSAAGPPDQPAPGSVIWAGRRYRALALAGGLYPAGPLQVTVLVPAGGLSCGATDRQTRTETIASVARRIYTGERTGSAVAAAARHVASSRRFSRAIARGDAPAARRAIIAFFATHLHVVRVRVIRRGRLLVDVGGPAVLAPVAVAIRDRGRPVGTALVAVQDDAGYVKLVHRFTGAQVQLFAGGRRVMGTLHPGPASVPDRGPLTYRGRRYDAYSFTGVAFPEGPLRISLLL